jgi:hypothetical protein
MRCKIITCEPLLPAHSDGAAVDREPGLLVHIAARCCYTLARFSSPAWG